MRDDVGRDLAHRLPGERVLLPQPVKPRQASSPRQLRREARVRHGWRSPRSAPRPAGPSTMPHSSSKCLSYGAKRSVGGTVASRRQPRRRNGCRYGLGMPRNARVACGEPQSNHIALDVTRPYFVQFAVLTHPRQVAHTRGLQWAYNSRASNLRERHRTDRRPCTRLVQHRRGMAASHRPPAQYAARSPPASPAMA